MDITRFLNLNQFIKPLIYLSKIRLHHMMDKDNECDGTSRSASALLIRTTSICCYDMAFCFDTK